MISESLFMHLHIIHGDQITGRAAQTSANIKIEKTGAEVAELAKAPPRV
jgi:hypothetical protein